MQRRTVLTGLAAGLAGLAGCSDGTESPAETGVPQGDGTSTGVTTSVGTPPVAEAFTVPDFSFREGPDGDLVVTVRARNVTGTERTARMTVTVAVDDEPVSASRRVTVAGGQTAAFDVTLPVSYAAWETNRNLQSITFAPPESGE